METKTCSLTEEEIISLIEFHGCRMHGNRDTSIERINYLNKRLKAEKKEAVLTPEPTEQKAATGW